MQDAETIAASSQNSGRYIIFCFDFDVLKMIIGIHIYDVLNPSMSFYYLPLSPYPQRTVTATPIWADDGTWGLQDCNYGLH